MAISIKTIGNNKYAYAAYRVGRKVIQEYLGPAADPLVAAKIAAEKSEKALPRELYPLFWDADPKILDVRRHSRYIVERILDFGDLSAIEWAQKRYPTSLIMDVLQVSRRLSERSRIFWRIWFGVEHAS